MATEKNEATEGSAEGAPAPRRTLTPEAERALAEAAERRAAAERDAKARAKELGGPEGPEPTRYGDWEKAGVVSDF
jgi:hypothetical protein